MVARVDSEEILTGELRDFVNRMPQGLRPQKKGGAAREEYLRSLLAQRLLYLEARLWAVDRMPTVQVEVEKCWRQHLIQAYLSEQPPPQVELIEEEIRAYFEENSLDRQRELAGILLEEATQAREVQKRLAAGERFEDLARQFSVHEGSAAQGGVWGFITLLEARRLEIPDHVFHTLPVGTLSDILPIGKRHLIMRFLQDRFVSLEEQLLHIVPLLEEKKRSELKRQRILALAQEFGWKLEADGVRLLLEKAGTRLPVHPQHLSLAEAIQPLFTYPDGSITLGNYIDSLWQNPGKALSGWGMRDSTEVIEVAEALFLEPGVLLEAARRAGIPERPEEQAWLEQTRREIMIRQFRRKEILDRVAVSEEEEREFYQKHRDFFRKSDQFDLVEVLVETEEKADALLAELERGSESLSSLAQTHTIRQTLKEKQGKMHLHGRDRFIKPELYQAAQMAEIGELVGPVQVKGGYSIFKVLQREEGEVPPFSEVAWKARSFVRKEKEHLFFEGLIDSLLERYQDRITVNIDELEAALPDTFLQRVATADHLEDED